MMNLLRFLCLILFVTICCAGCGHTQASKIGLISFGNLEGKTLPENPSGPVLLGVSNSGTGATSYYLSDAVREALKGTEYDTLLNADVVTETGLWVWSNKITVKGVAINSSKLD